jgi:hypothetical protein
LLQRLGLLLQDGEVDRTTCECACTGTTRQRANSFTPSHRFQRVALSFCGYGDASNWTRAEKLITTTPDRGRKWLQSGYKDEPIPVGIEWEGDEVFARGKSEGAKLKSALEGMREVVDSVDKV